MSSTFSATKAAYQQHLQTLQHNVLDECDKLRPETLRHINTPFDEALREEPYPEDVKQWLSDCLAWLDAVGGRSVLETLDTVKEKRDSIDCGQCGVCCRVASSEFTYDELREQAKAGDVFAEQFTRVFLPYPSLEDAKVAYPNVIAAMAKESGQDSSTENKPSNTPTELEANQPKEKTLSVYHCPYVGEDNKCTLYGDPKRPALCESYPENALVFVADECAWSDWKQTYHSDTVKAHAMLAVCQTYTQRIQNILSTL